MFGYATNLIVGSLLALCALGEVRQLGAERQLGEGHQTRKLLSYQALLASTPLCSSEEQRLNPGLCIQVSRSATRTHGAPQNGRPLFLADQSSHGKARQQLPLSGTQPVQRRSPPVSHSSQPVRAARNNVGGRYMRFGRGPHMTSQLDDDAAGVESARGDVIGARESLSGRYEGPGRSYVSDSAAVAAALLGNVKVRRDKPVFMRFGRGTE